MLRDDILEFVNTIDKNVNIVCATKYVDYTQMEKLLNVGLNNFGENRVEAFLEKYEKLKDKDITWHFIGHLQRNKALKVIDKIDYLHSLDSLKLAKIIDENRKSPLKCFIEVSINLEENKDGVSYLEIDNFIEELLKFKNIEIVGLMMMTLKYSSYEEAYLQFDKLRSLRDRLENKFNIKLPYLSMGMSDDYQSAIKAGATHIRLGRILWKM